MVFPIMDGPHEEDKGIAGMAGLLGPVGLGSSLASQLSPFSFPFLIIIIHSYFPIGK
jgi:hypothetical protein